MHNYSAKHDNCEAVCELLRWYDFYGNIAKSFNNAARKWLPCDLVPLFAKESALADVPLLILWYWEYKLLYHRAKRPMNTFTMNIGE